jgi:predicted dehydrogenase
MIMDPIRICIVGIGGMGSGHARLFFGDKVPGAKLVAVCDSNPERLTWARESLGEDILTFADSDAMFAAADTFDALVVATPHYDHVPLSLAGLKAGKHVLCEKPISVTTKAARELVEYAKTAEPIFGLMFNQRTIKAHQKLRALVQDGELGDLKRVVYIATDWYRSQSYYNSGGWRATWGGEGGGVLLNQCPHQLDLWQWICGMPKRIRANMYYGKYHDIEVEDDVTAYAEYENGAVGTFITSTAEAPGTMRLELSGDRGKVVYEHGKITFWRNMVPEREFNATFTGGFGTPEVWKCDVPTGGGGEGHLGIFKDWAKAIKSGDKDGMLAPGIEGINGLSLSNAMMLSDWTNDWVDLPFDDELFVAKLQEKVDGSTFKKEATGQTLDTEGTY